VLALSAVNRSIGLAVWNPGDQAQIIWSCGSSAGAPDDVFPFWRTFIMKRQSRKGFTLIELLVVVAIIALLIAILIPSLGRAKELANRSACGASLTGIVKALNLYAAENSDSFPLVLPPGSPNKITNAVPTPANAGGTGMGNSQQVINNYYGTVNAQLGDPMANLWILVLKGNVGPKQFICKSDPAAPTPSDQTDNSGNFYDNFGDVGTAHNSTIGNQSYSFAYMWTGTTPVGAGGWWRSTVDSSLPIAADIAPLNGTGTPTRALNTTLATAQGNSNFPKTVNSNNHTGGEGQNVGFADTHVEFDKNPYVGQGGDSIWTTGSSGAGSKSDQPYNSATSFIASCSTSTPFDILLVPVRDAGSNSLK
jgi:prepilin-type N-terminal cleavage/methylation domain-containing protein